MWEPLMVNTGRRVDAQGNVWMRTERREDGVTAGGLNRALSESGGWGADLEIGHESI